MQKARKCEPQQSAMHGLSLLLYLSMWLAGNASSYHRCNLGAKSGDEGTFFSFGGGKKGEEAVRHEPGQETHAFILAPLWTVRDNGFGPIGMPGKTIHVYPTVAVR